MKTLAILFILLGIWIVITGYQADLLFFMLMGFALVLFNILLFIILRSKRSIEINQDILKQLLDD